MKENVAFDHQWTLNHMNLNVMTTWRPHGVDEGLIAILVKIDAIQNLRIATQNKYCIELFAT